jgi:purine-binding chemotaxis protein CheW
MASLSTAVAETVVANENEEQLVTMIVDDQLFGIPILQVQDIVEATKITPVPLAPSAIAGVLNLRGRIVTVIDLRKLLGNTEEVPWDNQMGVTVEFKGDLYTLLVDAIGDVRTLSKRDFDGSPSTMEEKIRQLSSGIYRLRGNLLVVLDVSRILNTEAIESTPMLSVEERRSRRESAKSNSKDAESSRRQLSALMTDLNAYEKDTDNGLGDYDADVSKDIKERKRASRSRKAITERWQEVLDERARMEGRTVYRMNEVDDETLDKAQEEMKSEEAQWEEEWQVKQAEKGTGEDESEVDPDLDRQESDTVVPISDGLAVPGDPPPEPEAPASDEMIAPEDPVEETEAPASDEMIAPQDPIEVVETPASDEMTAPEDPVEETATPASDEMIAPEEPIETPREPIVEPEAAKMDEPEAAVEAPVEEPAAPDTFELVAPDDSVDEGDKPADDETLAFDGPAEPESEMLIAPDDPLDFTDTPESTDDDKSGDEGGGGWWNKLRGKSGDDSDKKTAKPKKAKSKAKAKSKTKSKSRKK